MCNHNMMNNCNCSKSEQIKKSLSIICKGGAISANCCEDCEAANCGGCDCDCHIDDEYPDNDDDDEDYDEDYDEDNEDDEDDEDYDDEEKDYEYEYADY